MGNSRPIGKILRTSGRYRNPPDDLWPSWPIWPVPRCGLAGSAPVQLQPGQRFALTTEDIVGDPHRVSVSFASLPKVVKPGDKLSLNDGYIQLEVTEVRGTEVACKVVVGGELRSRKGVNLPGINLGISA